MDETSGHFSAQNVASHLRYQALELSWFCSISHSHFFSGHIKYVLLLHAPITNIYLLYDLNHQKILWHSDQVIAWKFHVCHVLNGQHLDNNLYYRVKSAIFLTTLRSFMTSLMSARAWRVAGSRSSGSSTASSSPASAVRPISASNTAKKKMISMFRAHYLIHLKISMYKSLFNKGQYEKEIADSLKYVMVPTIALTCILSRNHCYWHRMITHSLSKLSGNSNFQNKMCTHPWTQSLKSFILTRKARWDVCWSQ